MKRLLFFLSAAALLLAGCTAKPVSGAVMTEPPATATPEVCQFQMTDSGDHHAALPTAPPTPTPGPTAVPTPEPKIKDVWYQERNAELFRLMQMNGVFTSDDEINAAIARMDIDPDKPMVALTFDDGPTSGVTNRVLDALEKHNCRATFFVVGERVAAHQQLLKRAVTLGCEIGSHTYGHDDLTKLSAERGRDSVQKSLDAVYDACGYRVKSLRPPTGASNSDVKKLASDMGLALVFWSHSTHDYRLKNAKTIEDYVFYDGENKRALQDGDIVLLHDLRDPTGSAVENIVSRLCDAGYQLVTVQELLNLSPDGFTAGKSYSHQ